MINCLKYYFKELDKESSEFLSEHEWIKTTAMAIGIFLLICLFKPEVQMFALYTIGYIVGTLILVASATTFIVAGTCFIFKLFWKYKTLGYTSLAVYALSCIGFFVYLEYLMFKLL